MFFAFYIFAALLIFLSYRSLRGGIDYLTYFKNELAKPRTDYQPFATVIAPFKGLDEDLAANIAALTEQDYPGYEMIFVVDDKNDPAVSVFKELLTRITSEKIKFIVAAKATHSSQKVENLREAVLHAADESRVFVFVDSDARPSTEWLRHLVAPLEDKKVGATTGYRWFISKKPTFSSELRAAWNASIASALGPNTGSNFCWGGSMAIRRDTFERIGIREKWLGTLSDDFTVTRAMNEANLPIVFVPQALTASVEDCTFGEMLEFTTRQMKITRVYAAKLWIMSFVGSGVFIGVMTVAFLIVLFENENDIAVAVAIATLVLVAVFSIGKSWLRLNAVRLVLTKYETELRKQFWTQNTLWLLTPAIFFCNSAAAWVSRRMTWRGIVYELKSPTETVIIAD
jgi:ceramide glucosyltransferase